MLARLLTPIASVLLALPTLAQSPAQATLYTRVEAGVVRAAIQIELEPGWHIYHGPTKVDLGHPKAVGAPTTVELGGASVAWSPVRFPEPIRIDQSEIEPDLFILGHEGTVVFWAAGRLAEGASGADVSAKLKGMVCAESCLPYSQSISSKGAGSDELFARFPADLLPLDVPVESPPVSDDETSAATISADAGSAGELEGEWEEDSILGKGLLGFLVSAVFWGLFTLLMPCTYPMIPITISFFTKQADKRGGNVLSLALAYGAGIVLIFILIGVLFGSVIIPFANHWITNLVIGIAFVLFSLTLFGLVDLQPPRILMNAAGKASMRGGYLGVFLMGATLVVTSFTCTAPFVGSLLGSSGGLTLGQVALGMGVFGLTMALPFVFLSLLPGRLKAMPRSGEWMNTLKFSLGFVELAAALKFLSNVDVDRRYQVISREFFLVAWGVIAVVLAFYLLGIARLWGRQVSVGITRAVFGFLAAGFAVFCFWGLPGRSMGELMAAFLPPYSGGRFFPELYKIEAKWPILENDYDEALQLAKSERKLLLVNFTGEL